MTVLRMVPVASAILLAVAPAAAAQAPQPTLQFAKSCYSDAESMAFTGSGFTPLGEVELLFGTPENFRGSYSTRADAAGAVSDSVRTTESDFLRADENRVTVFATANDRTRIEAGQQPPESQFAGTSFTFTRWMGFSPGRYVPGKRVRVEAFGWSFATGKKLYLLFRKKSRTVASVKVGSLKGDCGDVTARIRVPRSLKAGRYTVILSTKAKRPSEFYTSRKGRVPVKGAATSVALHSRRPMWRVDSPLPKRHSQAMTLPR